MAGWGARVSGWIWFVSLGADHAYESWTTEGVSPVWVVRGERQVLCDVDSCYQIIFVQSRLGRYTTRMTKETNAVFCVAPCHPSSSSL